MYRCLNYFRLLMIGISVVVLSACNSGSSEPNILTGAPFNPSSTTENQDADSGFVMVWNDEFEGNALNAANWIYDLGDGSSNGIPGWGNNELQFYQENNATVADGMLTIEAREEAVGGRNYTSARIKTQGLQSFRYGRIEMRAKLPQGQGMWPAFWMLGESISSVGWPASGEIDIMEMIGGEENTVVGTIHFDQNGHTYEGGNTTLDSGTFSEGFHRFSIEWDASRITWYVDDQAYHSESINSTARSELREDFFLLLNLAVGGDWPGSPDSSTIFPQQYIVDYVRVYQKTE